VPVNAVDQREAPVEDARPVADVDEVARTLLREGLALPGVVRVGLALSRGAGRELSFTASDRDAASAVEWCTIDGLADVPLTQAVRHGAAIHLPDVDALSDQYPAMADRQVAMGTRALAAYPLAEEGTVHGGVLLSFGSSQLFDPAQRGELATLVARTAAALTGAKERSRQVATGSSGRGPTSLPATGDVALGQHHRLVGPGAAGAGPGAAGAGPGTRPGIGWVEAVELAGGSVLLAAGHCGDGSGDGSGEVQRLRDAVRAAAVGVGDVDPAEVLDRLDRVPASSTAAAGVAVLDPGRRRLSAVTAGGSLVAVVGPGGARVLPVDGAPLGPTAVARRTTSLDLAPGAVVVLVGNPEVDAGHLTAALDRLADDSADPLLLSLMLGQEDLGTAAWSVLAARLAGSSGTQRVTLDLPDDATAPRAARRQVAAQLECWGAVDLIDLAQACVSELCTNALMHSATGPRAVLGIDARRVVVLVQNGGVGQVERSEPSEDGVGGRGLMLVEALASRWGWQVGAEGTTVWFELDRSPVEAPQG
jgi:hypothetical protein